MSALLSGDTDAGLCVSCVQSAAVLGLSRLVFEFAGQLEGVVGRLLPAVLLLLRSHSREVIKAVLGFIKVGWCVGGCN